MKSKINKIPIYCDHYWNFNIGSFFLSTNNSWDCKRCHYIWPHDPNRGDGYRYGDEPKVIIGYAENIIVSGE